MKLKRDQITGLVLILTGILFAVLISGFSKPMTAAYPGPKLLPSIGVFGLIVCGAGVFINGCRQSKQDVLFLTKKGWLHVLVSFGVLCVYILGMKYLGFLLVTPFVLYATITYFAKSSGAATKLVGRIISSVAITLIIYAMYVPLFGMTLPAGLLFE